MKTFVFNVLSLETGIKLTLKAPLFKDAVVRVHGIKGVDTRIEVDADVTFSQVVDTVKDWVTDDRNLILRTIKEIPYKTPSVI